MKLIRLFLKHSGVAVAIAVIASLLSGVSTAGLIALINLVLEGSTFPRVMLGWSFVGFSLLLLVTTATSQLFIGRIAQQLVFKLRLQLSRRILACSLRQLEEIGTPRLLATLTEDIETISNASFSIAVLCVNIALFMGCLVYLTWLSPLGFLPVMVLLGVGVAIHQFILKKGRHFFKLSRDQQDQLFQHFRTITEGIKELKLHQQRRQAFLVEDLQAAAAVSRHYRIKALDIFALANGWGLAAFFVLIGILIFVLPSIFNLSTSVLTGYALTLLFMLTPLRGILVALPELSRASVSLDKVETLGLSLASQTKEPETIVFTNHSSHWQSLALVGVTHSYPAEREDSHFVLGPLHLTFQPQELVFIVGGNGSGKSTLGKLITGLYTPEMGEIQVDGQPITDENRDWYRQHFSVVFSDFYLFDRLLGLEKSDLDQHTKDYLIQLHLDHKVTVENGKLSTTALSQGQRKRLALLTAYLEDRPIYVFDEWASDQDPTFKEIFYQHILIELKKRGKTVLVISHDDRYFHLADRIIKLDYGKVIHHQ
jgi:putative pyoverdin transport system ATP-binding/permease protein